MPPEIKFCGMTRGADVDAAVAAGACYIGVIFAAGPRRLTIDQAAALLSRVPAGVRRVGVFGPETGPDEAAGVARAVGLDVIQLHGDPDEHAVAGTRAAFGGRVWAAVRVAGMGRLRASAGLFRAADAVVVDAYSPHALGGTGVRLAWGDTAPALDAVRLPGKVVLAGGLTPETVAEAIRILAPDVVDVSSGVESAPGVKDHAKLRAFRAAVATAAGGPS